MASNLSNGSIYLWIFMATQPSSASAIAWAWALETMANFREVDATTIKDLFLQSPMISNDIGENAREAISFRILEKLFDLETTFTEPSFLASNPKGGFRLPTRCEDVLQIGKKMHGANLQDELEELKWNVQSIIMHKRSRLPKCALQKLKDAIREDKHPSLAFLKQRSGLIISGKLETSIHRNDCDCNTNAQTTIYRCHTYPYSNPYKKAELFPEVPHLVEDKSGTKDDVEGQKGPILLSCCY
ncbi:hypothetical protein L6452_03977 [Arctium lappa]|uniref:Uncharacterized protein n=1 Tax=Arctium lappa TaxID=4217 RepID=A0ACB9FND7_ARCLA|nr:hypothetical protein L6452_03977 [Arctium lappa]